MSAVYRYKLLRGSYRGASLDLKSFDVEPLNFNINAWREWLRDTQRVRTPFGRHGSTHMTGAICRSPNGAHPRKDPSRQKIVTQHACLPTANCGML